MDFTKYSKRQEQIISGEIPILQAGDIEVRRLFIKALNAFDKNVITFAEKELERRSVYITNSRQAYCEKQKDVIDGKVALEDLSQTDLIRFYARTKYQGDRQLGEKIAEELRRRGRWINKIEGYNARQTLIIRGEIDIHTVHDAAVRGLRNAAIAAGDMDVLEWVEEEYSRRNLENSEKELNQIYDLEYLVSRNLFDKMSDTDINYAVYLASKSNNEDALQRLSEEVIERSNHSRSQLYYEREIDIINGVTLLEETSRWVLTNLLEKLKIDDSCDRSELIENIERELQKRDLERTALVNAQKNEYTSNQKAVIEGEIPLYRESTEALKTILRKAERRGETEEVAEIKNEVEARSKKLEEGQPYSDLQQMLINSMRKVESERRESLLKYKVEAHEEEEYKRIVEEYKHERSKRPIPISAQVKDLRDDEYKECLEEYLRTRPYTNRQLEIMEGSIPLDKVKTKDLINLVNKARALNDDDYADYLTDYLKNRGNRNHNNVSGIIRGEIPYEEITIYQLKALPSHLT